MQENIRKIVDAAKQSLEAPESLGACPRQNVAKSVAKARKTHHVTNPQLQPHQQHRSNFPQKYTLPPLFRPKLTNHAP